MVEQNSVTDPWIWSVFYGISLLLLAVAAWISVRRFGGPRTAILVKWCVALALASLTATVAQNADKWWPWLPKDAVDSLRASIIFSLGTAATWLLVAAIVHQREDRTARCTVFLLVEAAWLLALSSVQVDQMASPATFNDALIAQCDVRDDQLIKIRGSNLQTDQGRPVPIYQVDAFWKQVQSPATFRPDHDAATQYSLISQAPPDFNANCHGWVFTGGRYVVRGAEVENILSDNRYLPVDAPEPGDLIVYRSPSENAVVHTGVVKVVEPGLILIESKWGLWGRYLHRPQHQPYSPQFAFYRSPRAGHRLTDAGRAPAGVARQPAARAPSPRQVVRKKRIQLSCIMPSTSALL